jgi:type I restriction enzyme R subunit
MAKVYYNELKKQIDENNKNLKIATIFSFSPNEEDIEGFLPDEDFNTTALDQSSRDFLEGAIADYNSYFGTAFDTSSDRFENYYKDISQRMKNREIDILVVVNMFLTGFDATTLNTLWVDKNLRQHGLLQAFSRTNRILNSIKTFGNIICFRNLKRATDDSIALFGDKDASGIVLIKTYEEYYNGYEDEYEVYQPGYKELIEKLRTRFPLGEQIVGEEAKKEFINLYGKILRYKNILSSFDEFEGNEILSERDEQNYQSRYVDLYFEFKKDGDSEKESINDDVEFEIELFRQIEVNIDYILILVAKYRDKNCQDKKLRVDIDNAINSSIELRSKKDLIERFIDQISPDGDIDEEWKVYLRNSKEKEIEEIIKQENLNPEKTRKFIERSFKTGNLRTTGTEINDLMPPISRFREQGRDEKKNKIIELLLKIFERFFGLV